MTKSTPPPKRSWLGLVGRACLWFGFVPFVLLAVYGHYLEWSSATRVLRGQPSARYMLQSQFVTAADANRLVRYFDDNIGRLATTDSSNANYNGRVIYFNRVDDVGIRTLLNEIKYTTAYRLRAFYKLTKLYSDSCHIVLWRKGDELGTHADNAFWPSGKPNYSRHRSHSAVVFLNDDYGGGAFYFDNENRTVTIQPRTGTMVGFGAGLRYAHGVRKVTAGRRLMVAMWFTQNVSHAAV